MKIFFTAEYNEEELKVVHSKMPESLIMHIRLHLPKYSFRLYRSLASVFQALFRR